MERVQVILARRAVLLCTPDQQQRYLGEARQERKDSQFFEPVPAKQVGPLMRGEQPAVFETIDFVRVEIGVDTGRILAISHWQTGSEGGDLPYDSELAMLPPPDGTRSIIRCDLLVPGFVDIHTHGRGSSASGEVLEEWTDDTLERGLKLVAREGTTSILATVTFPAVADDKSDVAGRTLKCLKRWVGRTDHNGACIAGMHWEGPCVSDLGGLVKSDSALSPADFDAFLERFDGALRVMTIAPSADRQNQNRKPADSVDGNDEGSYPRIRLLRARGITAALGHDRQASEDDILGALRLQQPGWRMHLTHLFNVQALHHRIPGLANFGLISQFPALPEFGSLVPPTVEVIGDLVHVHPLAVQAVLSSRNSADVSFISDSILGAQPKSGEEDTDDAVREHFTYGGRLVRIHSPEGGRPHVVVATHDGSDVIAGSCVSMGDMFATAMSVFRQSPESAATMCSLAPARVARLTDDVGAIALGLRADFAVFMDLDRAANVTGIKEFKLSHTIVAGRIVFSDNQPDNSS